MLSSATWQISQERATAEVTITIQPQITIQHLLLNQTPKYYRIGKQNSWSKKRVLNPAFQQNRLENFTEHQCTSPTSDPIQQNSWEWELGLGIAFTFSRFKDAQQEVTSSLAGETTDFIDTHIFTWNNSTKMLPDNIRWGIREMPLIMSECWEIQDGQEKKSDLRQGWGGQSC